MNSKFVTVLLTIFLFSGIILAQHDPLFDNFEDQNNTTNWGTRWEIFADDDVNTTSDPAIGDSVVYADGAAGTSYCGYLTGSFSGWGLGLVGWFDPSGEALGVDLSEFKGVSFYAMGNNQPVRVVMREIERYAEFDFYNYIITPGDDWALYTIPFDSLYLMWEDETLPPFHLMMPRRSISGYVQRIRTLKYLWMRSILYRSTIHSLMTLRIKTIPQIGVQDGRFLPTMM